MFKAADALKITGLNYRQLDSAVRTHALRPTGKAGLGHGSNRLFTSRDVLVLVVMAALLRARHRVGPFMPVLRFLHRGRLPALEHMDRKLVISEGGRVRVVDAAKPNAFGGIGEGVVHVVNLGRVAREVRRAIHRVEKQKLKRERSRTRN